METQDGQIVHGASDIKDSISKQINRVLRDSNSREEIIQGVLKPHYKINAAGWEIL